MKVVRAVRRDAVALMREPAANPLHEVGETNPTTGIHVDLEARISTRTLMAEKGTEPCTEAFNESILSPFARIMTTPWAEVETDRQGLMDQIDPRNGVILHARLGRRKNGSNIAIASLEGSSRCKFFFLAAV